MSIDAKTADQKHAQLIAAMIEFNAGYPDLTHHFLKVHNYAKTIGILEGLDDEALFILETAAIVHDIAIRYCLEEFGKADGPLQEKYGPDFVRRLLGKMDYEPAVIERVAYLVGHHHTYTNVDGPDYRILLEADFLVNSQENHCSKEAIVTFMENVFETAAGKSFLKQMFQL